MFNTIKKNKKRTNEVAFGDLILTVMRGRWEKCKL
jgi:hypothetical protein